MCVCVERGTEYWMKKEQNVSAKTIEGAGKHKRVIESEREADGDEGLGREAKPLRKKR